MSLIPLEVARYIELYKIHPLASWRMYFSLSQAEMANMLDLQVSQLERIEASNLHLQPDILDKFSKTFKVDRSALEIRYLNQYSQ